MPKAVLDTVGVTIVRGAAPKMWDTDVYSRVSSWAPKDVNSLKDFYDAETAIFKAAKKQYRAPKKGNDNAEEHKTVL